MVKVSRWLALFLVTVLIMGTFGTVLAQEPTVEPIPEGVKVAGMPEVLPTRPN